MDLTPTIVFLITLSVATIISVSVAWNLLRENQMLRGRLSREGRDDAKDPGPLTDRDLRRVLSSNFFPASKTLDRVQDAFERIQKERDELRKQ